ncbi:MAG: nucleoside-diphosphate kinase [Sedimentisphaerales bacterium]|nr:nucleoside-diphosphate kinase [Sedimentisphaerales bacterium]
MAERTLIIIKPDAIQRGLAGEIISRFEQKGFKLVASKFMKISKTLAQKHYAVHKDKPFFARVVAYLSSSPSLVMVWQADHIIKMSRRMMGETFGTEASPGTIRGDFGCSQGFNLIHGSDSPASADQEIPLYFKNDEICDYPLANEHWLYGDKEEG